MHVHPDRRGTWWHSIVTLALRYHELRREIQQQPEPPQERLNGLLEQEATEHISQLQNMNECLQLLNDDLQHNHTLLHTIFNTITDGLLLLDSSGTILAANRAISLLLGASPDALIDQSWDTLCASVRAQPDTRLSLPELCDLPFESGTSSFYQHNQHIHLDGNTRVIDIYAFPVYHNNTTYPQQTTTQVVLHIVDGTERLVVDALMREQERLAASRELVGKIAHEVNSPLQAILNSLILVEQASEDERSELLTLAQHEIERIGQLLHQLDYFYQGM